MTLVLGKLHHEDGTFDFAIAEDEAAGDEKGGKHVVAFSEKDGGGVQHYHNVPQGTSGGEFSS